jgi:hypothetical protein
VIKFNHFGQLAKENWKIAYPHYLLSLSDSLELFWSQSTIVIFLESLQVDSKNRSLGIAITYELYFCFSC